MDLAFDILFWAVLLYEVVALLTKKLGDTISEHSWDARDYYWGRMFVDTLLIWLLWHIIIDDQFFQAGASWVDVFIVAGGVAWSHYSFKWSNSS